MSNRNEGEGNRTAAREYNEATKKFVESGKVPEKAEEARQAFEGKEKSALEAAERTGRSHAKGEDPQVSR